MAKALDAPLRRIAEQLIARFGKDAVLILRDNSDTYDPATMSSTPGPPTEHPCQVVVEDVRGFQTREDGSLTIGQARKVTLAAKGLPSPLTSSAAVRLDGQLHELTEFSPVFSGDEVCIYQALIRR